VPILLSPRLAGNRDVLLQHTDRLKGTCTLTTPRTITSRSVTPTDRRFPDVRGGIPVRSAPNPRSAPPMSLQSAPLSRNTSPAPMRPGSNWSSSSSTAQTLSQKIGIAQRPPGSSLAGSHGSGGNPFQHMRLVQPPPDPLTGSHGSGGTTNFQLVQPPADSLAGSLRSAVGGAHLGTPLNYRLSQPPQPQPQESPALSHRSLGNPLTASVNLWLGKEQSRPQRASSTIRSRAPPARAASCPPAPGVNAMLPALSEQLTTIERTMVIPDDGAATPQPGAPLFGSAGPLTPQLRSRSPPGQRTVRVRQHYRQCWTLQSEERFVLQGAAP